MCGRLDGDPLGPWELGIKHHCQSWTFVDVDWDCKNSLRYIDFSESYQLSHFFGREKRCLDQKSKHMKADQADSMETT